MSLRELMGLIDDSWEGTQPTCSKESRRARASTKLQYADHTRRSFTPIVKKKNTPTNRKHKRKCFQPKQSPCRTGIYFTKEMFIALLQEAEEEEAAVK